MSLHDLIDNGRVKRIIAHPEDRDALWRADLARFLSGDDTLTRKSAGESGIKAVQRLLIFLGYSTSSNGAFAIDNRRLSRISAARSVPSDASSRSRARSTPPVAIWSLALITTWPSGNLLMSDWI